MSSFGLLPLSLVLSGVPVPVLLSCNFDVVDTVGGYNVTLIGTGLGFESDDAIIDPGGAEEIAVTIVSNDGTTLVFEMPPMPAGIYPIVVETDGGVSNALTLIVEEDPVAWLDVHRAIVAPGNLIEEIPNTVASSTIANLDDLAVKARAGSYSPPTYNGVHSSYGNKPMSVGAGNQWLTSDILGTAIAGDLTLYLVGRSTSTNGYFCDDVDGTARIAILDTASDPPGYKPYVHVAGYDMFGGPAETLNQRLVMAVILRTASPSTIHINDPGSPFKTGGSIPTTALKSITWMNRYTLASSGLWGELGLLAMFKGDHFATGALPRHLNRLTAMYATPPFLYSSSPGSGGVLNFVGSALAAATLCSFTPTGGGAALAGTINTNTSTALSVTPPGTPGSYNVTVVNAQGTSNILAVTI